MSNEEEDMLNSGDLVLKNDLEMANRINNYDHVQSTVVKRDDKGNVTHQWNEVVKIIRINKRKPFIGGYKNVNNDV